MTVSEWADLYRKLSPESSAEPGQWRTDRTPYLKEPMDCVSDPLTQEIVIMSCSQIGKTELLLCVLAYLIDYDPCPIMLLQPTIEMAQTFSKDRLAPMLRDTPCLRGKVMDVKTRSSGNTMLHKSFDGGHITMAGANSPASLASRPVRVVLADEIDRYPASAGSEGDPLGLITKRTKNFWNRILIWVSTPTIKGASRIEDKYLQSSQGRYHLFCPACGNSQQILRKHLIQRLDQNGEIISVDAACEHCGLVSSELEWRSKVGIWVHKFPKNPVKGFHLNTYVSTWSSWVAIEKEFQIAKLKPETLQVFINTELAETWREISDEIKQDLLIKRREGYSKIPAQACLLTCGVDVQDNRFELEVVAWGEGDENWNIDYRVIRGDTAKQALWDELEEFLLKKTYPHELGIELKIVATGIDTGGHRTQECYRFIDKHKNRRIYGIKGQGGSGVSLVRPGKGRIGKSGKEIDIYIVGIDEMKLKTKAMLEQTEVGPGFCHFPLDRDEQYFEGLTAERLVVRSQKGFPVKTWEKDSNTSNEPWDCRQYATAALRLLNPVYKLVMLSITPKNSNQDSYIGTQKVASEKTQTEKTKTEKPNEQKPPSVLEQIKRLRSKKTINRGWIA